MKTSTCRWHKGAIRLSVTVAILGTWCLVGAPLWGALTWERLDISTKAGLTDTDVEVDFPFQNNSTETIVITKTTTSCGCTVVSLNNSSIAPGQRSVIHVSYVIGQRSGPQHSIIHVVTNSGDQPQTDLHLRVALPPGPVISPVVQFWRVGDPLTAKTTTITLPVGLPLTIKRIVPQGNLFVVEHQISADGRSATLMITPRLSERNNGIDIEIHAAGGDPLIEKVYHAYATVSETVPPEPVELKPAGELLKPSHE
jgi:Protein of unknown function (DUF1573)